MECSCNRREKQVYKKIFNDHTPGNPLGPFPPGDPGGP